ncbi:transcription initiation factor TFIID subunit 5-like [Humulus lupulus]|uniref:transcription initiation factor TFIID subunit 5-like n=1 Tax=Humulus lupulus TaxID=3486 RepID=UPI002B40A2DD|nr:transcription initiation factor TFIID subunit 5-like [Humulus lupulus]
MSFFCNFYLSLNLPLYLVLSNEHINFQVSPGQPNSISDDAEAVTLTGSSQDAVSQINQKEIHWGLLEDSLEELLEKTGGLLSDSKKAEGETKESEWEENKITRRRKAGLIS